ncbi:hypothetical protein MRX96_023119 [Rhipicephalus microplus]
MEPLAPASPLRLLAPSRRAPLLSMAKMWSKSAGIEDANDSCRQEFDRREPKQQPSIAHPASNCARTTLLLTGTIGWPPVSANSSPPPSLHKQNRSFFDCAVLLRLCLRRTVNTPTAPVVI